MSSHGALSRAHTLRPALHCATPPFVPCRATWPPHSWLSRFFLPSVAVGPACPTSTPLATPATSRHRNATPRHAHTAAARRRAERATMPGVPGVGRIRRPAGRRTRCPCRARAGAARRFVGTLAPCLPLPGSPSRLTAASGARGGGAARLAGHCAELRTAGIPAVEGGRGRGREGCGGGSCGGGGACGPRGGGGGGEVFPPRGQGCSGAGWGRVLLVTATHLCRVSPPPPLDDRRAPSVANITVVLLHHVRVPPSFCCLRVGRSAQGEAATFSIYGGSGGR